MTNARVRFRLVFAQPHELRQRQTAFEPVANGVQETFCTALICLGELLGLFLGSAIRIQNGIVDGIELAVQSNNILHLTAEDDATNASHIEF